MTRRKRMPSVASFGEDLLALLLKGSTQQVEVTLSSVSEATKLRHRIHILRSAMRFYEHADAALVEKAKVRIVDTKVIVEPQDFEFKDAIKKANVSTPQLDVDPLAGFDAQPGGSMGGKK